MMITLTPVGGVSIPATTFTFQQPSAASVWTLAHNLNRYPSVTVVDTAGNIIEGDVQYVNANTIVLTFNASFSGNAYLN